ncbi:hypothetical protein SS50377_26885 [Spironucleus salmonicida]|uniref:Uncharacterized protein n=1 Tax=Spironucleus salmonicida TaxID=348837 RepID=V6LUL5_9EUKA|nr:hypothetical protein SS50377_26885 [Spironucleus salmonicida]|eukprot:EST47396.1 Hypothetical protein SS50377_12383 [Spironucleus salmonicida]
MPIDPKFAVKSIKLFLVQPWLTQVQTKLCTRLPRTQYFIARTYNYQKQKLSVFLLLYYVCTVIWISVQSSEIRSKFGDHWSIGQIARHDFVKLVGDRSQVRIIVIIMQKFQRTNCDTHPY